MRVTVLGLGRMGRAMAVRLLAEGHEVTGWNRTPGPGAQVVAHGGHEVPTPTAAVADARAVLTALADDDALRAVVLGADGVAECLPAGAVLVDTSTVGPATTRALAAALPGRFVAAPVLGAPEAVLEGRATCLLGGDPAVVDSLDPIWSALAAHRRRCGADPADATTVKLLVNYLLLAGVAVLAEAVALAQAVGLDPALVREVVTASPAVAPALHRRLDDVQCGDHRGWFSTRLAAKDVRLAAELAESLGVALPLAELTQRRYEDAVRAGWAEHDVGALVELFRAAGPA